jgi:CheY-like chemotaxis protein
MQDFADSHTILIADNDPVSLKNLTRYFQRKGDRVIPAPNLQATEILLESNWKELDAAILDGRMEVEDSDRDRTGWDLAERTADKNPQDLKPIVIHSRVEPQASPYASLDIQEPQPRENIFELPKSKGVVELSKFVKEKIQRNIQRERQLSGERTVAEEAEIFPDQFWTKQHKALAALIAVLLTLTCGLGAVVFGESRLLLAAVVSAVVAVVFISMTLD